MEASVEDKKKKQKPKSQKTYTHFQTALVFSTRESIHCFVHIEQDYP